MNDSAGGNHPSSSEEALRAANVQAVRYPEIFGGAKRTSLEDFPLLTKRALREALPSVLAQAGARDGGILLGSGGTTSQPQLAAVGWDMNLREIATGWPAVRSGDLVLNTNNGSELSSMNPFYNGLIQSLGASTVPIGLVAQESLPVWLELLQDVPINVIASTPSYAALLGSIIVDLGLADLARRIQRVAWTGEPLTNADNSEIRRAFPNVKLYGLYGSTETWVVGRSFDDCSLSHYHVLRNQFVEIIDGRITVTSIWQEQLMPIVRYEIGDRGEFAKCSCNREGPVVHVEGRVGREVKFQSILVDPQDVIDVVMRFPGVDRCQLEFADEGSEDERLIISVVGRVDRAALLRDVLERVYRLGHEVPFGSTRVQVRGVDELRMDARSGKVPSVLRTAR